MMNDIYGMINLPFQGEAHWGNQKPKALPLGLNKLGFKPGEKAAVLEVFTDAGVNVSVFREFFRKVKG